MRLFADKSFECQSNFTSCKFSESLKQILDTVPPESEALSPSDTLGIFRSLREVTHKLTQQPDSSYNVTHHRNFNILCRALTISMPYIEISGKLDILNAIKNLSVPVDSKIYNTVLMSFNENLFNMSLNEIMVLDRILSSSNQKSQMIDDLRGNLIDQFNLKSSKLKVEMNYFMKMRRMLQFIERNRYEIAEEVFENMGNCAVKQDVDILTAYEAIDTMILLSNFGNRSEHIWPILNKAFDVWCNSEVTIRMVETVLRILVRKNRYSNDVSQFKDWRFIETCARTAIANGDVEKCFLILRYLNQLVRASFPLISF